MTILERISRGERIEDIERDLRLKPRRKPHNPLIEAAKSFTEKPKAIPTFYNGVNMRSRLEAQCAVLFDKLGWKWEYEKYSLMLPSGTSFTPDFWIEDRWLLVECRGYSTKHGDRQISEFSTLLQSAEYSSRRVPELALPDGNGEFYNFLVVGPEYARVYQRVRREEPAVLCLCRCGLWNIDHLYHTINNGDLSGGHACVHAAALHVREGKILLNGSLVEDWEPGTAK